MNSLDAKFSCFTPSPMQHHSLFSNCEETKPLTLTQSKVASHVLTANNPTDWHLFFSFVLAGFLHTKMVTLVN